MEDLRQHDEEQVHHALSALLPLGQRRGVEEERRWPPPSRPGGWGALPPDEAERVVLRVLGNAGFDLRQSPPPEEIARRLVGKLAQRRAMPTSIRRWPSCAGWLVCAARPTRCWPG